MSARARRRGSPAARPCSSPARRCGARPPPAAPRATRQPPQVVDHARAHVALASRRGRGCRRSAPRSPWPRPRARSRRGSPSASPPRGARSRPGPGRRRRAATGPGDPVQAARSRPVALGSPYSIMCAGVWRYRLQPRVSARHAGQRARPPRGRGAATSLSWPSLRHARLHLRRGRHARPGARLPGGVRAPAPTTSR